MTEYEEEYGLELNLYRVAVGFPGLAVARGIEAGFGSPNDVIFDAMADDPEVVEFLKALHAAREREQKAMSEKGHNRAEMIRP